MHTIYNIIPKLIFPFLMAVFVLLIPAGSAHAFQQEQSDGSDESSTYYGGAFLGGYQDVVAGATFTLRTIVIYPGAGTTELDCDDDNITLWQTGFPQFLASSTSIIPGVTACVYRNFTGVSVTSGDTIRLTFNQTLNHDYTLNGTDSGTVATGYIHQGTGVTTPGTVGINNIQYILSDDGGYVPPPSVATRFISLTPDQGEAFTSPASSSFPIEAIGYVGTDFTICRTVIDPDGHPCGNNITVNFQVVRNTLITTWATTLFQKDFEYDYSLGTDFEGGFAFATTTDFSGLEDGAYRIEAEIHREGLFGYVLEKRVLVHNFTIGTTTALDAWNSQVVDAIGNLVYGPSDGSENPAVACGTSFDINGCVAYLFQPTQEQTSNFIAGYTGQFLSKAPFGYLKRFQEILSSTNQVEPPPLSYTFGDSSPEELQGRTYTVQIWDHMDEFNSIESDTTHEGVWDIVMPYFNMAIGMAVVLVIIQEIISLDFGSPSSNGDFAKDRGAHGRIKRAADGTRYREYSTGDVKRMLKKGENNSVVH